MSSELPQEGQWYRYRDDEVFFVIAVHQDEGLIDVRDVFGDVDEFDFDEWEGMRPEVCGQPAPESYTDMSEEHPSFVFPRWG